MVAFDRPIAQPLARVSIIIPVLGDNAAVASLLGELRQWTQAPCEIIVVDGGSDPQCREICMQGRATWLASAPGRGRQMNRGATAASGEILWFLHADAR